MIQKTQNPNLVQMGGEALLEKILIQKIALLLQTHF